MQPPDLLAVQRADGTQSTLFVFESLLNRQPWLGGLVWYLAVHGLGALSFLLTYVAFGSLAGHGYPLAQHASRHC